METKHTNSAAGGRKKRKRIRRQTGGGRFSAVDVVILVLVVASLAGTLVGWIWEARQKEADIEEGGRYFVTFRIEEIHREVWSNLSTADRLYFVDDGGFFGYLRDDWSMQASAEDEMRLSGTGSMVCVGEMPARTLILSTDGRRVTPGEVLQIRTETELLTVRILTIREAA